mmetsp:Transcript_11754/g.40184  ORF Transcript_11754/g.40184 Transcript_11754/m.40184 type:complete len:374 (+) Transcript_11754:1822-2943(+)
MAAAPLVLAKRLDGLLSVTLNRPKALNALSTEMIRHLAQVLGAVDSDPSCKCVVLRGAGGKAFCAGGDMRAVVDAGRADVKEAQAFFAAEYALDAAVAESQTPHVAVWDGIVMGGGVGLSAHSAFRVATERTLFAMPETSIGFFTDVAASYFLSRLPGQMGTYLGLTGARVGPADALALGLATHFVPSESAGDRLDESLAVCGSKEEVRACLEALRGGAAPPSPDPSVLDHAQTIARCFKGDTVSDILRALDGDGSGWARDTAAHLRAQSPTGLVATLRLLRAGPAGGLRACLARDYSLTTLFLRPGSDLYEGIRAVLVDKDKRPRWKPEGVEDVDVAELERALAGELASEEERAVMRSLLRGTDASRLRATL